MLQQWEYRKLTPVGRLTIIKFLIIPKLKHLINIQLTKSEPIISKNFLRINYAILYGEVKYTK